MDFFSFRKSDRRVMLWMLIAGLLAVTLLIFCCQPEKKAEGDLIEQPKHWWNEKK